MVMDGATPLVDCVRARRNLQVSRVINAHPISTAHSVLYIVNPMLRATGTVYAMQMDLVRVQPVSQGPHALTVTPPTSATQLA
jgi:transcriptional regulatory protein LevR